MIGDKLPKINLGTKISPQLIVTANNYLISYGLIQMSKYFIDTSFLPKQVNKQANFS